MVKNLPSNTGDMGSIPGQGTTIPHAVGQLSLRTATTEPTCSRAHAPQLESLSATTTERAHSGARVPQQRAHTLHRKIPHAAMAIPCATTKT